MSSSSSSSRGPAEALDFTHAPLKRGLIFQTASGPRLENWPSDSSMKKMGIPQIASMMKYGTRKAPARSKGNTLRITQSEHLKPICDKE